MFNFFKKNIQAYHLNNISVIISSLPTDDEYIVEEIIKTFHVILKLIDNNIHLVTKRLHNKTPLGLRCSNKAKYKELKNIIYTNEKVLKNDLEMHLNNILSSLYDEDPYKLKLIKSMRKIGIKPLLTQ